MPVDDSKQVRPGAAFGIPEGATGEEVVDAVFGQDGIDPELLPYLEAAGAPDLAEGLTVSELQEAGAQRQADAEAQDREDLEALRELVAANMIPGGDTDRLEELLAEVDADDSDDWESWEPQLPDDSEGEHLRDLQAAARGVEVAARMREVEAEILARAPEHQVQPSLERVEAVLDLLGNPERTYRTVHITGTNGKTTTTSLVEKILLRAGKTAVACGNYGVPVAEILLRDSVPDVLALEVSSFQLETIRDFHPDVAVWLNFAPDHMDRYKSVEDYHRAKLHIFDNQTEKDLAVVRSGERLPHLKASVLTFSPEDPAADLYYREPLILEGGASLLNLEETALNQRHNAENAMAAVLACRHLGIPAETAAEVLKEFAPPGHRCETVRTLDGVLWLNDSKATNLHALETALKSQHSPVILIAGGKDKGLDYVPLRPMLKEKVRACVVFGQIADQLQHAFSPAVPTEKAADVEACVEKARSLARQGDTVLFSPGTSSFDMFTGYVQRGQAFRDAVNALPSFPDNSPENDHHENDQDT